MTALDVDALSQLWRVEDLEPDGESAVPRRPFLMLPSAEHPRLVVPTGPHRAAGVIIGALRDGSSAKSRAKNLAVRAALATGARRTQLPDPELLAVVMTHLPHDDYIYGVHLGPPRANRKPVLALATASGELVAFVKCGLNPLTDRLVRTETSALPALVNLTSLSAPCLLGHGEHGAHPYLVQSPVPTHRRRLRADAASTVAAQVEVASIGLGTIESVAALGAVADQWKKRIAATAGADRVVAAFAELAFSWVALAGDQSLQWGSWHGDWRLTNMAVTASGCSVWDWERFATGVPVGYDALHLFLTSRAPSVHDLTSLPGDLFDNAERLLRPFDVANRADAELTTLGYLLELAGRYLDDNQSLAGGRLGAVQEWLLPFLSAKLTGVADT